MEAQGYRIRQSTNSGPTWKKIVVESNVPEQLNPLRELSRNLWWAWSDEARALFSEIDPVIWEECEHNPIVLLEETSLERFEELKSDQSFILRMKSAENQLNKYLEERKVLLGPKIAYFSMEFGLHSSLKIYSGGLGVLAGDFLKEASDSKVDMTGVWNLTGTLTDTKSMNGVEFTYIWAGDLTLSETGINGQASGHWGGKGTSMANGQSIAYEYDIGSIMKFNNVVVANKAPTGGSTYAKTWSSVKLNGMAFAQGTSAWEGTKTYP